MSPQGSQRVLESTADCEEEVAIALHPPPPTNGLLGPKDWPAMNKQDRTERKIPPKSDLEDDGPDEDSCRDVYSPMILRHAECCKTAKVGQRQAPQSHGVEHTVQQASIGYQRR